MLKTNCTTIELQKGVVYLYDFGEIELHAYKTNDPIDDECFVLVKGGACVVLESPCFFDNCDELAAYISEKGWKVDGVLLSYHMAGASFLPQARKLATAKADEYGHAGGGKTLIDGFTVAFGEAFDGQVHDVTETIEPGALVLAGIEMEVVETQEAYDVEIPAIKAVYTHMLGHDCHSIVAGPHHAESMIGQLNRYIDAGYDLILTSHYTPEDLKDAETKIAYLEELGALAAESADAASFKAKVLGRYPAYAGENYLDLTAGLFFAA